jgi:NitT/TauT family transport system substrate-binding protein
LPRPRAWHRTLGALGGVLVLAITASACSSGSGSPEKSTLNVGVVDGLGAATLGLGVSQHYFSDAGLTINVVPEATDAAAESALKSGSIDLALGDYSEFLNSGLLSSDGSTTNPSPVASTVQVVGEGYNAGENTVGLVVRTGSSLANQSLTGSSGVVAEIAGTANNNSVTVEVPDLASPEYVALANWAIAEQSPLDAGGQHVKSASNNTDGATTAQTMVNAVLSGSAGAAVLQEPYLTQALESGAVTELANLDTGDADNMPVSGYFALQSTTKNDPNTIAAFQAALAKSQALGVSRVEVEAALTAAGSKVTKQLAATTAIGNYPIGIVAANLTNVLSLMTNAGLQISTLTSDTLTGVAS